MEILPRISDYVVTNARSNPDGEALVLDDRRWSHADVAAAIDALATALLAFGIRKGDRVATLQTPHPDFWIAFLATASIGAIWVGLNPRYRLPEIAHVIRDSSPSVLLARTTVDNRDYRGDLEELGALCNVPMVIFDNDPPLSVAATMTEFLRRGTTLDPRHLVAARHACGGRDPCMIVYTSGSTGTPKGALLHHEGIARFAVGQNALWPVDPLRVLNFLPINHIGCLVDISAPALVAGGTIVFQERFDPAESMALIARERLTIWGSVPTVFGMQLALPQFEQYDLNSVQLIAWGGAAMGEDLARRLLRLCPRLATNYGMTETSSAITSLAPTNDLATLTGSVGPAFPGVDIKLVDADGNAVADGDPGEVLARSQLNFLGYWQRPDDTASAFDDDGYFRTGDLAVRRPDGHYRIVGRVKEMFKSGGYNVFPAEIEAVIEAHPAVGQVAVVGVPDPVWQEAGVAFVVMTGSADIAELTNWCRERLANYKVPKRFIMEDSLPLLPIGKVDKLALRVLAASLSA